MKKLIAVFILVLMTFSLSASTVWLSREQIEFSEMTSFAGINVKACAICTTKEEVEKLCHIENLDDHFSNIIGTSEAKTECYTVGFLELTKGCPRMFVYHFIPQGQVELYLIY